MDGDDFDDMMSTGDLQHLVEGDHLRNYARSEQIELLIERPNLNDWASVYSASHDMCKYIKALAEQNKYTLRNRVEYILCDCRGHKGACLAEGQFTQQCISCFVNNLYSVTVFPCPLVSSCIRYSEPVNVLLDHILLEKQHLVDSYFDHELNAFMASKTASYPGPKGKVKGVSLTSIGTPDIYTLHTLNGPIIPGGNLVLSQVKEFPQFAPLSSLHSDYTTTDPMTQTGKVEDSITTSTVSDTTNTGTVSISNSTVGTSTVSSASNNAVVSNSYSIINSSTITTPNASSTINGASILPTASTVSAVRTLTNSTITNSTISSTQGTQYFTPISRPLSAGVPMITTHNNTLSTSTPVMSTGASTYTQDMGAYVNYMAAQVNQLQQSHTQQMQQLQDQMQAKLKQMEAQNALLQGQLAATHATHATQATNATQHTPLQHSNMEILSSFTNAIKSALERKPGEVNTGARARINIPTLRSNFTPRDFQDFLIQAKNYFDVAGTTFQVNLYNLKTQCGLPRFMALALEKADSLTSAFQILRLSGPDTSCLYKTELRELLHSPPMESSDEHAVMIFAQNFCTKLRSFSLRYDTDLSNEDTKVCLTKLSCAIVSSQYLQAIAGVHTKGDISNIDYFGTTSV